MITIFNSHSGTVNSHGELHWIYIGIRISRMREFESIWVVFNFLKTNRTHILWTHIIRSLTSRKLSQWKWYRNVKPKLPNHERTCESDVQAFSPTRKSFPASNIQTCDEDFHGSRTRKLYQWNHSAILRASQILEKDFSQISSLPTQLVTLTQPENLATGKPVALAM